MPRSWLLIAICLLAGLLLQPGASRAEETAEEAARRLLAEADSTTWFALNDAGDLDTFDRGLELVDEAGTLIATLPDGPVKDELLASAQALWADLRWQKEIFHDKLSAVFPLIRFYGTTLLLDTNALGSLELFDDPRDRAAEQALRGLLQVELVGQPTRAQLDAVFGASPPEPELESAGLVFLNSLPGFFVHNGREVAAALQPLDPSGALARGLAEGRLPAWQRQRALAVLAQAFGAQRLFYVTLAKQPAFDGEYFFIARGELLNASGEPALDPIQVMGFGRDRTQLIWPLAAIQVLLWMLAVWLHHRLRGGRFEAADLAPASVGFFVGRVAPWLLLPVLSRVRPDDGMLMTVGFWWPAVAGAALLLVPVLLLRLVGPRLPFIAPYLAWDRGLESLALGIGCGLAAWIAVPLLALRELAGLGSFLVAVPGLLGACWLVARLARGEGQLWFAPFIALVLGLTLATARLDWIAGGTAVVLAGLLLARRRAAAAAAPASVAPAASYRPFGALSALQAAAQPLDEGRVAWVALTGPAGSGKTSHVRALIADLATREGGRPLLLLDGACQHLPDGGSVPFGPFQRCLAQHLKVDVARLAGQEASEGLYNVLLGPLAPLFSGSGGLAASERDLFHFVTRALKQQAAAARVVLLVDDAEYLDEASAGLLAHLQAALPAGSDGALLVLLVGRRESEADRLAALLPGCSTITLGALTLAEQEDLLRQGYGLAPAVADWVLDWLGARRGQAILPHQLAEVVEQLGRAQALRGDETGLAFAPGFDKARPPLAASAVAEVRQALERLPQTLDTLSLAAAFGRRFEAKLVASALQQNRKTVLKDLEVLERETGLVRDVLEEDDVFEFRSQRALDAVREALGLRLKGPAATDVTQAVREVHAQAARALAERAAAGEAPDALADLLAQATHWYGAGRSHCAAAVTANLAAARRLAALLRFAEAEGFLKQAEDCAAHVERDDEVRTTALWLAAERAYVTGQGARAAATAGLAFLAGHPTAPAWLVLVIARACYEAGRDGGPSLAAEAERLGLAIAEDTAAAPLDRAQGLHLAGLALRFDPPRAAEGRRRLAEALDLAERQGAEGELLTGQIANSLGIMEQAAGPERYAAAEALFRRSLELKQRQAIPDRPGLARSYGGLGLLILDGGDRARLQEAEDYLRRDLALAEELGDRNGLSKVRLWLGRCHLLQGETAAAKASFEAALSLAFSLADVTTAEAGLLEVAAAEHDLAGFLARARGLAERFAERPVPRESRPELARALAWPHAAGDAAVQALGQRLAEAA